MISRYSPPLLSLGTFDSTVAKLLDKATAQAVTTPGFFEEGRASRNVDLRNAIKAEDQVLVDLVHYVGDAYLGLLAASETTAFVSKVTDAALFNEKSKQEKAASYWHNDFVHGSKCGFDPVPDSQLRIIFATEQGTESIEGNHYFPDGVRAPYYNRQPTRDERLAALALGNVVYNWEETVLMRSTVDPIGGNFVTSAPGNIYILPANTVHRTPTDQINGRVFAQIHYPVTPAQRVQILGSLPIA